MVTRSSPPLPLDLVPGGPTFRLMLRVGLANPAAPRLVRAALVLVLISWVPLALLTLLAGTALLGGIELPFARDFAVHARLLLAVPLFLVAEISVGPRLRAVAGTFVRSGLVRDDAIEAYERAVRSALRLRDSAAAEIALVALAILWAIISTHVKLSLHSASWAASVDASGAHLSAAGWWYALVGLPVFLFLLLRSIWRGYIWTRFLGAMARLDLSLVATHPDHAGGLGFVGAGQTSWIMLVLAISIVLAGSFADAVVYGGAHVTDFKLPIAGFGALVAIALLAPLLRFRGLLARTRFTALLEYGALVHDHHLAFDRKWIGGAGGGDGSLLGNPDPSSLADASAGYELVAAMRTIPVALKDLTPLAVAVALPMVPLFAIEIPLVEILKKLLAIVA